jgi:hypothetical protein
MKEGFEFKFVGPKDEDDPQKKYASASLAEFRLQGLERMAGELEKTDLQNRAISTVNQIILLIYRYFGVEKKEQIDPDQVHFLNTEEFNKQTHHTNAGAYSSTDGSIVINFDVIKNDQAHLITLLLHESLHAVSEQHFYVGDDGTKLKGLFDARVGLRTKSSWKSSRVEMRGLNEFVVNSMVYYSLSKLKEVLKERFGITDEDLERPIYGGGAGHQDFFESLADKMEQSGKVDMSRFIGNLIRSHFSGSLKSFKDIDLVFGNGSIRVLGYLDSFENEERGEKVNLLVEEYFLKADEERKKKIQEIIFDEEKSG